MKVYFYLLNYNARRFGIYWQNGLFEISMYFYNLIITWGEE